MRMVIIPVIIFVLFISVNSGTIKAGGCDDLYNIAKGNIDTAKTFMNQKNYEKAQEVFLTAAGQFDRVAAMNDCSSGRVSEMSVENANYCRDMASDIRKSVAKHAEEERLSEAYNRAKAVLDQGNAQMQRHEWLNAISSFDQAASQFDQVAAATPKSYIGQKAAELARYARGNADLIREYKKKNLYR